MCHAWEFRRGTDLPSKADGATGTAMPLASAQLRTICRRAQFVVKAFVVSWLPVLGHVVCPRPSHSAMLDLSYDCIHPEGGQES